MYVELRERRLEQRDVAVAADAVAAGAPDAGEHRDRRDVAAGEVDERERRSWSGGPSGSPVRLIQPARPCIDVVVGALGRARAGHAEAGERAADDARVDVAQVARSAAAACAGWSPRRFEKTASAPRDEVLEHRAAVAARQVERDAALVAVERLEEERVLALLERRDVAADVAADARVLDLDDLGAEIGQLQRRPTDPRRTARRRRPGRRRAAATSMDTVPFGDAAPVRPGRRLHHQAVPRQPGRGRARRRRARRRADAALRELDEPVRDDVRAAADRPGGRLPRPHLHAGAGAAVRRPPDARHVPRLARGRRRAARRAPIVQECAAGLVRVRRTPTGSPSRRRRSSAPGRSTRRSSTAIAAACSGSAAREIVDAAVGRQRPRLDRGPARERGGGARAAAGLRRPRHRRRRAVPARLAGGVRGARVLPEGRLDVEDPVTGQPERVARAVAAAHRPRDARRTWRARAPRSAARAASTSRATPTGTIWVGGGTVTCVAGEVEL